MLRCSFVCLSLLAPAAAFTVRAAPARMSAAATPSVELLQFLPIPPPVDPGADAVLALSMEAGAQLSSPVWLAQLQTLAFIDRGRQLCWSVDADAPPRALQPTDARSHAVLGSSAKTQSAGLATCDSAGRLVLVVGADPASVVTTVPPPLEGAAELGPVRCVVPLSEARLLAVGEADVTLLSADPERTAQMAAFVPRRPVRLLEGVAGIVGACVSEDERALYLLTPSALYISAIDLDLGTCSAPEPVPLVPAGCESAAAVATDAVGNLYVCTADGVVVGDAQGEPFLSIATPEPATGCCFGGPSLSQLYIAAGPAVWRLRTNTQGVAQLSSDFIWQMETLAAAGEFRHDGW